MWSMPRSVLRFVAVILGLCAVGGFILGVRGAPERARLPGEASGGGAPIQASDAQPLDDLVLTPSELAPEPKKEEEKPAEETEQAPLPVEKAPELKAAPAPKAPTTPPPEEDRVGDLIDGLTPPPEQPPY
ncbi:MAG: hypothetical protein C0481_13840 [Phenylobacterium sp.]|nr:hypothetical protein [Phenylobacterium sp.]